jgi:hypothetical protein
MGRCHLGERKKEKRQKMRGKIEDKMVKINTTGAKIQPKWVYE